MRLPSTDRLPSELMHMALHRVDDSTIHGGQTRVCSLACKLVTDRLSLTGPE